MNFSDEMYTNYEHIEAYNRLFPEVALTTKEEVGHLLYIGQELKGNLANFNKYLLQEIEEESKYEKVYKVIVDFIESGEVSDKFESIVNAAATLKEYRKNTLEYIREKRFNITTKELAEILDVDENYISRNLMNEFDYFRMKREARHAIKCFENDFNNDFLNKFIFLSRDSVRAFLKKYLKYSNRRIQVDLTMPDEKFMELRKKFKTDKAYRTAIRKAISDLDRIAEQMKVEKENNNKFTRLDLPLYSITDDMINDILSRDTTIKSIKTIIGEVKTLDRMKYELDENAEYNYIGMSSKQAYDILDHNIGTVRFVLDDLVKNREIDIDEDKLKTDLIEYLLNKNASVDEISNTITINTNDIINIFKVNKDLLFRIQNYGEENTTERKFLVRYAANIKDLIDYRDSEADNYLYALDSDAYKSIIKDSKTETERREAIIKHFYTEMMKPEFKINERKKEKNK